MSIETQTAVGFVGGLAGALMLTPLFGKIMMRLGAVDYPGGRHQHEKPTPRGAGLAIVIGFLFAVWLSGNGMAGAFRGLLAGLAVLVPICLLDDFFRLPPLPRLVAQIVAAALAWQFGVRIEGVTNLLAQRVGQPYLPLGWLSLPATVLWIVLLTNAVNWLDGLDGLAAGVCAITSATLAYMGYVAGRAEVAAAAAGLCGASLGFLRYNFAPARVFMGDTGSMFLGFSIACIATVGAFKSTALTALVAPLLAAGVPLYDIVSTSLGRIRRGQPVYEADRTHVHYRLVDRGLKPVQAVLVLYAVTAALCAVAVIIWRY